MGDMKDKGIDATMRPDEAVTLAMERERQAREFYLQCAATVADPGVKKMFLFLANEEGRHFELLEREYDRFVAGEN